MEKIKITWKDFDESVDEIVEGYKDQGLKRIIGISRGGLPLAVKLSNRLGVPMIPLEWQTRDGNIKDSGKLWSILRGDISKTLFVDDICDSGRTIRQISSLIPGSRWCTLVTKDLLAVEYSPIFIGREDRWIVFPWE